MDVVCNIDDNYTKFCGVMLTSLFENNRDEDITVHVLGRAQIGRASCRERV